MLPGISQSTKDLIFRKIHKIQFLHILIFSSGASLYNLAATSLSCISNLAAVLMIPVTQGQREWCTTPSGICWWLWLKRRWVPVDVGDRKGIPPQSLHRLQIMECTLPPLLFIYCHLFSSFSCLRKTWWDWDGVKEDVWRVRVKWKTG